MGPMENLASLIVNPCENPGLEILAQGLRLF